MRKKRARGRPKKPVAKQPTFANEPAPVSADEEVFLNFVGQNVDENPLPNEINNIGSVQFNAQMEFSSSSSSSSSSSENEGSFRLGGSTSESDEPATNMRVKKPAMKGLRNKRGQTKKDEASRKATNASAMSLKGLSYALKSSKGLSSMTRKEIPVPKKPSQDRRYNKEELKAALAVIQKVMEMDEAVPFNAPVDPVSQGIPDYFTVIGTPMDFGTIRSNLQNDVHYMNSDDVYKDVEYIWENCLKYNKKGDYIVYLMKRVKKKFMKYWTAAGLCTEMLRTHSGPSHLAPSSDHAIRQSIHETMSMMNHMVTNSNQLQQDTFHTGQRQPQVHLSSYAQVYQSHQPQPRITQVSQFSQLQAGVDSSYAGNSHMPGPPVTVRERQAPQYPISSTMSGAIHSQQQPQPNSHYMWQSQQSTSQLQPSKSHFGHQQLLPPMDCTMTNTECTPRSSMDPMFSSMGQPQSQHHLSSHCQQNESHQPRASRGQPQPSNPQTSVDISSAGMPHVNSSRRKRRHMQRYSAGPEPEIQLVSGNSQPLQPLASQNQLHGSDQSAPEKRRKVRGPTKCRFMWDMSDGERIFVPINMLGQPVGPEACKLASFLGTIARDGKKAPLNYLDWSAMPKAIKEEMWQFVQTKFDIDPLCKTWVLKSLASKWRNWKAKLKAAHYTPHATDEERLKDCNKRVLPDQWAALVAHWNSEEVQLRSVKNKANRAKQKSSHAAGSKSFARICDEERAKRSDGKEPSRAELYILTRTRKNGQPVNETAADVITKLHGKANIEQQTSDGSNDHADTFCQVMGEERSDHVQMYGLVPNHADIYGRKPSRISLMRMAWEAKRSANEEVGKMLSKMEAMEQKYGSLEAQIVNMTSNMQNLINKMGDLGSKQVPNNAPKDSMQAQAHSSSSSYAVEENIWEISLQSLLMGFGLNIFVTS